MMILGKNKHLFQDSLPQSFSYRDHLIDFLTRVGEETDVDQCQLILEHALGSFRDSTGWDTVSSYNVCMMTGLSKFPDEFFETYAGLDELDSLNAMLHGANLPSLPNP